MKDFRADLHIHTLLSPCGDLNMTPLNIIKESRAKKLDLIGITDHNTTRQVRLVKELGDEEGIFVLPGVEVNTREEVHCLAFFENLEKLELFQLYLDRYLQEIPHNHEKMGDQVQIDREEMIVYREDKSLFSILNQSVEDVEKEIHHMGGLFIPAHINRPGNGILSQLGFIPDGLNCDALEIRPDYFIDDSVTDYTLIHSSDAHFLVDIGKRLTSFRMQEISFTEIKQALSGKNGREVRLL